MKKIECENGHITTYEILALPAGDLKYWTCPVHVYRNGAVVECGESIKYSSSLRYENTAWCPNCFDAMDCVELKDSKGMISNHIYQCFGCDKWFEFKEFDLGERAFGNSTNSVPEKMIGEKDIPMYLDGYEQGRKDEAEEVLKLVEARLLFPYRGSLVSGVDKTREWTLDNQQTDFNKLCRELRARFQNVTKNEINTPVMEKSSQRESVKTAPSDLPENEIHSQENKSQERRMMSSSRSTSSPLIESLEDGTNPPDIHSHNVETIQKDSYPYRQNDIHKEIKEEIDKDYIKELKKIIDNHPKSNKNLLMTLINKIDEFDAKDKLNEGEKK